MGDLAVDTAVEGEDGRYVARLSRDWEIWGPNGGYVASVALRAAGATSRFPRPASFAAHYLGVADFDTVDLAVRPLRRAKKAESLAVTMSQGDRPIMEAMVWTVDEVAGLEHDETVAPDVDHHAGLPTRAELAPEDAPPFRFWDNFDNKPLRWIADWPPPDPLPATASSWYRYAPTATFDDPFVDAARSLLLIDTLQWPAATGPHAPEPSRFIAPTIDLSVNFHRLAPEVEWLLCVASAPIATDGLIGGRAEVWTDDGRLLASGGGHMLCRPVPDGTPGAA